MKSKPELWSPGHVGALVVAIKDTTASGIITDFVICTDKGWEWLRHGEMLKASEYPMLYRALCPNIEPDETTEFRLPNLKDPIGYMPPRHELLTNQSPRLSP